MSGKDLNADILAAVAARSEQNNKRRLIDLQELIKTTQFTKQEIMMMYRGFKQVKLILPFFSPGVACKAGGSRSGVGESVSQ